MGEISPLIALSDQINEIVDCGCCTTDELSVLNIAQWWLGTHPGEQHIWERDFDIIDAVYNFEIWRRGYNPARSQRASDDPNWHPRGAVEHWPAIGRNATG